MKLFITPQLNQVKDDNGVGRVIHAQYNHLRQFDVKLVSNPHDADIIAAHINADNLPRIDVLHCHGLYWTGEPGGTYDNWHHDSNSRIIEAARKAEVVTVPSQWVSECFKRDMRINPAVIGHGIEMDQWQPTKDKGYILWNKNRASDVCDPNPAHTLAERGFDVVSTFSANRRIPDKLKIVGTVKHDMMKEIVRHAQIYLATTKETFGIGTLEALAAGVPVLGYNWGGTADLIQHKVNGYLVEPGDIDGLIEGIEWIQSSREHLSRDARNSAAQYSWDVICSQYFNLYQDILEKRATRSKGVSVVITCYNYQDYVGQAIESVLSQTQQPEELIVVNDGSSDESLVAIQSALDSLNAGQTKCVVINQPNQGVAAARNNGIQAATQEHIICLDADDMLAPEYVETLHNAMVQDRGLGVAYVGLMMIRANGEQIGQSGFPPDFNWETQAKPGVPPPNCIPSAAMFRRDMWARAGGYKQVYAPGEDAEFWTRGLSIGFRAQKINDSPLFFYRTHGGGAHNTKKYTSVDTWHPWMRDKKYPMGAPASKKPLVHSYSAPVISVIIPVGPGHTKYLPAAVDSVLGQTFRHWELIVVNDTGSDLSYPEYPFIRVVGSSASHPGAARNLGIQAAKAPLVFFLDADDFIVPQTLEKMLARLLESGQYVYSDWVTLSGDKITSHQAGEYQQDQIYQVLPHAVTALVPTDWARAVGGFDEDIKGWEEWDFYAKLASQGYCGTRLAEPLLYYRADTGMVRKRSFANKNGLLDIIKQRHGRIEMGCCGGNAGDEILAVKRSMAQSMRAFNQDVNQVLGEGVQVVRMRFIGQQQGAQVWKSKAEPRNPNRQYRGANDGINNYADVHRDDVEFLLGTGFWELVSQPTKQQPNSRAVEVVSPTVETPFLTDTPVMQVPLQPEVPAINFNPDDLSGDLPDSVTVIKQPEEQKRKSGRPKNRGYVEDIQEEKNF